MSQFAVVWGEMPKMPPELRLSLLPVGLAQDHVRRAATALLDQAELVSAWQVVDETTDTISQLFASAWPIMVEQPFRDTRLGKTLSLLMAEASLALWGAGGWDDLAAFDTPEALLAHAREEVVSGSEVYAVYTKRVW